MSTDTTTPTLYERLGGQPGIARLIDAFYDKVVADPEIGLFFAHTPMDRLRAMQKSSSRRRWKVPSATRA